MFMLSFMSGLSKFLVLPAQFKSRLLQYTVEIDYSSIHFTLKAVLHFNGQKPLASLQDFSQVLKEHNMR